MNTQTTPEAVKHTPKWEIDSPFTDTIQVGPRQGLLKMEVIEIESGSPVATVMGKTKKEVESRAILVTTAPTMKAQIEELTRQRDAIIAEARELLKNATYADGQAIVLTQDCEALEAAINGPAPHELDAMQDIEEQKGRESMENM